MKIKVFSIFFILTVVLMLNGLNVFAQDSPQWHLPEGARARLGKGTIGVIAYSPDGTLLAVASSIGIWLYNDNGEELDLLTGQTRVTSIAFSPNGQKFVSASESGSIYLWDVETKEHTYLFSGTRNVSSIVFSPDGKTIVTTGSYTETSDLWDVETGRYKQTLRGHTEWINSVDFSPDGKTIATGSRDSTIRLWDAETGQHLHTLRGHTGSVESVDFSPDGKTIATGNWDSPRDSTIHLWDVETRQLTRTLTGHSSPVLSVAFSPDGKTIASGSHDDTVRLWDVETAENTHTLEGHTTWIENIVFSPDGKTIASSNWEEIYLWDVATTTQKQAIKGHTGWIRSIDISPDGKTIVIISYNKDILWDIGTRKYKQTLKNPWNLSYVAFSPDGKTIAGGGINTIGLWDAETGERTKRFSGLERFSGGPAQIESIAFSPNGKTIATGGADGTVLLWDVEIGKDTHTLAGHTSFVNSISFSPDGKTIATGSTDQTVRLWDAETGKLKHTLEGHTNNVHGVAFSPDGKTVASGAYGDRVYLWDPETGQRKQISNGGVPRGDRVAFSPDGKTIAIGEFYTIRLWDVKTQQYTHTFTGHTESITNVVFSPDGQTLASSSRDGTVLLWDTTPPVNVEATVHVSVPMYWIDKTHGTLHRSTGTTVENIATSVRGATGIAVDVAGGKIYWTQQTSDRTGKIQCADLEGSNVQLVKDLTSAPRSIAIDTLNNKLYLTNSWGKVQRMNFDGSSFRPNLITGLTSPTSLALDVAGGKIYWIQQTSARTGTVQCANLNGSNVQLVRNLKSAPHDITIDTLNNKLYLTNSWGKVQRMNFNASGFEPNLITGRNAPLGIVLDAVGGKVYWTEAGSVYRANLNGENIQTVVTGLDTPSDIVLQISTNMSPAAPRNALLKSGEAPIPDESRLFANYPNPFNPETWIPYQLADPADVTLYIYSASGVLVRTLSLGSQAAGVCQDHSRAAYWDGRNAQGELVASGIYFYSLMAGDFKATRKMVIRK